MSEHRFLNQHRSKRSPSSQTIAMKVMRVILPLFSFIVLCLLPREASLSSHAYVRVATDLFELTSGRTIPRLTDSGQESEAKARFESEQEALLQALAHSLVERLQAHAPGLKLLRLADTYPTIAASSYLGEEESNAEATYLSATKEYQGICKIVFFVVTKDEIAHRTLTVAVSQPPTFKQLKQWSTAVTRVLE